MPDFNAADQKRDTCSCAEDSSLLSVAAALPSLRATSESLSSYQSVQHLVTQSEFRKVRSAKESKAVLVVTVFGY